MKKNIFVVRKFTLEDLVRLQAKGKDMTMRENEYLEECLQIIMRSPITVDGIEPDNRKRRFLSCLGTLVKEDCPNLDKVVEIFGIGMQSTFEHDSRRLENFN